MGCRLPGGISGSYVGGELMNEQMRCSMKLSMRYVLGLPAAT
jgi:hypothetical protein